MFWMRAFAGMTPPRRCEFITLRPSEESKNRIPYDMAGKICNCVIEDERGAGKGGGPIWTAPSSRDFLHSHQF